MPSTMPSVPSAPTGTFMNQLMFDTRSRLARPWRGPAVEEVVDAGVLVAACGGRSAACSTRGCTHRRSCRGRRTWCPSRSSSALPSFERSVDARRRGRCCAAPRWCRRPSSARRCRRRRRARQSTAWLPPRSTMRSVSPAATTCDHGARASSTSSWTTTAPAGGATSGGVGRRHRARPSRCSSVFSKARSRSGAGRSERIGVGPRRPPGGEPHVAGGVVGALVERVGRARPPATTTSISARSSTRPGPPGADSSSEPSSPTRTPAKRLMPGREVTTVEAVLGGGERAAGHGRWAPAVDAAVAVARLVGPAVGVPAQRVVALAGVVDDRHEHAAHVGQQDGTGAEVGLPLHLDGVGDVEALARLAAGAAARLQAGVARQVGDAQHRAPGQAPLGVAPRADRLVPDHVGGGDPVGKLPCARRRDRHARARRGPAGSGRGPGPARACSWRSAPHPRLASLPPIRTQPTIGPALFRWIIETRSRMTALPPRCNLPDGEFTSLKRRRHTLRHGAVDAPVARRPVPSAHARDEGAAAPSAPAGATATPRRTGRPRSTGQAVEGDAVDEILAAASPSSASTGSAAPR